MNRRSFFTALAKGIAAVTILPAATTYARAAWKATEMPFDPTKYVGKWAVNPAWINAEYECSFMMDSHAYSVLLPRGFLRTLDPYPIRYNKDPITGLFSRVPDIIPTLRNQP